jgi:hypothetical protein
MIVSGNRYLAQTLKESLEAECVICFNELEAGDRIARLNCLCIYHEHCIGMFKYNTLILLNNNVNISGMVRKEKLMSGSLQIVLIY